MINLFKKYKLIISTEKKEKKYNIYKYLAILLLAFLSIFILINLFIHPLSLNHFLFSSSYGLMANWEMDNSELVNQVVDYCNPFDYEDKVKCVINQVGKNYNYTYRNESFKLKKSDNITEGYLCRDIAV